MSATVERQATTSNGLHTTETLDGDLPIQLPLELLIDDPEVIRALVEYSEGEARNSDGWAAA